MTASSHGRKRGRSPSSNCDECLPISKRINKLHIQSSRSSTEERYDLNLCPSQGCGNGQNSPEDGQLPWQQQPGNNSANQNLGANNFGNNNNVNCPSLMQRQEVNMRQEEIQKQRAVQAYSQQYGVSEEDFNGYRPELGARENPFYFHINNVLYDAHVDRASRHGNIDEGRN